jgi:formamidopyrimidine-DNA glycosylase
VPELPDVVVYLEHVARCTVGRELHELQLMSPFVLRTVEPPASDLHGKKVTGTRRLGKRVVLDFEADLFAVIHLMVAGRLHWLAPGSKLHKKRTLLAFHFEHGLLQLTEAGTKKRASLHLVRGVEGLADHDRGGVDVFGSSPEVFAEQLRVENHTLKRSLTDPRLFSGIGNSYSDEILHRAQLSPVAMSKKLTDEQITALRAATLEVLEEWTDRLRDESGDEFPEGVTAFRPEMAVHGKYKEPCPRCGAPVQRIVYASRETNYCAPCQTGGRLLADRGLSRLLGKDWPKSIEELEARRTTGKR